MPEPSKPVRIAWWSAAALLECAAAVLILIAVVTFDDVLAKSTFSALFGMPGVAAFCIVGGFCCSLKARGGVPVTSGGVEPREDVVLRAKATLDRYPCDCGNSVCRQANPRELSRVVPELVAEIERLRAHIAAMPSAIQAYADGELTAISYVSAHPSLTNAELVAFTAEKDTLLRFQRDAESIVAYAATAVQR